MGDAMQNSPVNRLDRHWPKRPGPEADRFSDETAWSRMAKTWEENLENFMADHPKLTVAAAAALGLVLGWMVKRK